MELNCERGKMTEIPTKALFTCLEKGELIEAKWKSLYLTVTLICCQR